MISYFLITLFLLINTIIQIMLKTIALGPGGSDYMILILEPSFYFCGLLFIVQTVLWLAVLRRLPLSRAYPFTSLSVITMIISGSIFFGESITLGNMLGAVVITTGVIVIAGDQGKENKSNTGRLSFFTI
jgi:drug/metabolite transporter (DMT)-like permease